MDVSDDNSQRKSFSKNPKTLCNLETLLVQSLAACRELATEIQQLQDDSEAYKSQIANNGETSESVRCYSCERLKTLVAAKDNKIQVVASVLTKLYDTKDLNLITEAFQALCGEKKIITLPADCKATKKADENIPLHTREEQDISITENVSLEHESVSEIEGTPTGRISPIIQSRLSKVISTTLTSEVRENKKKCPSSWPSPVSKCVKLSFSTPKRGKPNGKLKQARFNVINVKHTQVVDLTSSPECAGGRDTQRTFIQPLVKKESTDNDDTILPSPTSGPTIPIIPKTAINSPIKAKKSLSCKRIKSEIENQPVNEIVKTEPMDESMDVNKMEESINLLKPLNRFPTHKGMVAKTEFSVDDSMSLLQHVKISKNNENPAELKEISPNKTPLAENINLVNVPQDVVTESRKPLFSRDSVKMAATDNKFKRKTPEKIVPVYKEPAPRTKADKRALPGWSCVECKNFYAELYKDNTDMLLKKMEECSKHRGKNNPERPLTPKGFWNPRWDVPTDTEEFNRRNNVT